MMNVSGSSLALHSSCVKLLSFPSFFFFQAEDGIRDSSVTGVQTCALPIWGRDRGRRWWPSGRSSRCCGAWAGAVAAGDRESVVEGKRVDLGGRRIIKKKKIA